MKDENIEEEVVETEEETTEEETHEEETEEEETEEETTEEGVDYEGELKNIVDTREHNKTNAERRLKNKGKLDGDSNPDDIKTVMREVIQEVRASDKESYASDVLEEELSKITNEGERKLVADHYHNTIKVSGTGRADIERDVAMARTLANQPRLRRENSEAKIALKNRKGMGSDSSGSNQDRTIKKKSKWTETQLADFKKRGITPEQVEKTMAKQSAEKV